MLDAIQTICSPTVREVAGLAVSVGALALLFVRASGSAPFRLLLAGLGALALSYFVGTMALVTGIVDPQSPVYVIALVGLRTYIGLPLIVLGAIAGAAGTLTGKIEGSQNVDLGSDQPDAQELFDKLEKKREHLEQARYHIGEQAAEVNRLNEKLRETLDLLLSSEEKFRTLFECGHDGYLVLDLEKLTIQQANPRLADLTGYDAGELAGRPLVDICDEASRSVEPERLRELLIRGRMQPLTLVGKSGETLPLGMSFSLVNVGGDPVLMGIAGDVSESVRLRQELERKNRILEDGEDELRAANEKLSEDAEKMRRMNERLRDLQAVKDGFLSSVSHELRTPLTSIRSFSEILLVNEDATEEEKREFITIISAEAERLTRLVNDVLDLAKIESGKIELSMAPVDLNLLAREVVRSLAPLAQQSSIAVESRIPAELPPVMGDRDRLHQVLTNLLSNALKFSPAGALVVLNASPNDEGMVQVGLEDQGPGISKKELARIFDKFRQVDDTVSVKPEGTGLGLAICREIINQHGGRVWVRSATGLGATFYFTVPVATKTASKPEKMSIADKVRAAAEKARRGETTDLDLDFVLKADEAAEERHEPEMSVTGAVEITGELPPLTRTKREGDTRQNLPRLPGT